MLRMRALKIASVVCFGGLCLRPVAGEQIHVLLLDVDDLND